MARCGRRAYAYAYGPPLNVHRSKAIVTGCIIADLTRPVDSPTCYATGV